jgi:hypothetical protein
MASSTSSQTLYLFSRVHREAISWRLYLSIMVVPLVGELRRARLNFHDSKKKAAEAALPCVGHKTIMDN